MMVHKKNRKTIAICRQKFQFHIGYNNIELSLVKNTYFKSDNLHMMLYSIILNSEARGKI